MISGNRKSRKVPDFKVRANTLPDSAADKHFENDVLPNGKQTISLRG